jgi:transcriptional regulator with XRE-family HTH domain
MAIDLKDYLATLPEARRQAIRARAEELIAEELSLAELRKDLEKSQVALAKKMGVRQADVSKIERRSDMHVSTLRKYVEAAGGSLEIIVRVPGKPPRRLTFNTHHVGSIELPPGEKVVRAKAAPEGVSSGAPPRPLKPAKAAVARAKAAAAQAKAGVPKAKGTATKKAATERPAVVSRTRPRTKRSGTI